MKAEMKTELWLAPPDKKTYMHARWAVKEFPFNPRPVLGVKPDATHLPFFQVIRKDEHDLALAEIARLKQRVMDLERELGL